MFVALNLLVRFLLELGALVALGAWGWHVEGPLLGLLLPSAAAVLWGAYASPKSAASPRIKRATQTLVLGGAALSLLVTASPRLAAVFAVITVVNAALLRRVRPSQLSAAPAHVVRPM
jgi:hypothetical protein